MSKLEENYNYEELIQSLILNNNLKEIKKLFNNKNILEYKDYALKYSCSNYKTEKIKNKINIYLRRIKIKKISNVSTKL